MKRFEGKVVLVTGGSSGIGLATVRRLHDEGARIMIADLQGPIEAAPGEVTYERLDVSDEGQWQRVVSLLIGEMGRIDVLIQCAGMATLPPIHEETLEGWAKTIGTNQTGVFLGMKTVIPHMLAAGQGSIVNVSSHLSQAGIPIMASYHASKGAVTSLSRQAAIVYAKNGIRVNTLHPGPTMTPLVMGAGQEAIDATVAGVPLGRLADPSEQAGAIAFLASDDASFITGASLFVDGGYTAA